MFAGFQLHRATPAELDEARAVNAQLSAVAATLPAPGVIPVEVIRANRRLGKGGLPKPVVDPDAVDVALQGSSGLRPGRMFRTPGAEGLYIHLHGGGWVFGSVYEQDPFLRALARQAGLDVLSVDYRLAPEAPAPAGIDDVTETLLAAAHEWPDTPLLVGGESAGAHLALSAVLRLRSSPEVLRRIVALNLSYGIYDLSMSPSQRLWRPGAPGLSAPHLAWMIEQFTPGLNPEQRRNPDLSPLYADLADLPPALFSVGAQDILLDDTLFLAARWAAAGNQTELRVYPQAAHGFNGLPTGMARAANRQIHGFLKARAQGVAAPAEVG